MKKFYLSMVAFWAASSLLWADPISLQKAKSIAAAYMQQKTVPEPVAFSSVTKGLSNNQAPLYIFNRGEDKGFVIVSGDDCLPEVLGYTEKGDFNTSELPPALLNWIEGYSKMIEYAQEQQMPARIQTRSVTVKESIPPLVKAHWAQGAPYNNSCPFRKDGGGRALTGCVATAAAQVAHYWRKENPERTLAATPTYGYGDAPVTESIPAGTPLKWDLMQTQYGESTPEDMNTAVATLMSVIGTSSWLTYGASTSGQISNLVYTFSSQFNLNSTCTYKSNITQANWENMIYEELAKGWPIVYSGVSPTQGGHAVVVDGYDATNNLFHFNFGWGGGGDGYFTVNDINGMNGFNGSQGMTHNIHPQKNKLKGTLTHTALYSRMKNPIEVEITNNGTTDYQGVYLVASRRNSCPTSVANANAKDITTVIPKGEKKSLTLPCYLAGSYTAYLFLLDKNAQLLDSAVIEIESQQPELTLQNFGIDGHPDGGKEDIVIEGKPQTVSFYNVYQNGVKAEAQVQNALAATPTSPAIHCSLLSYSEEKAGFTVASSQETQDILMKSGESHSFSFEFTDLEKEKLYAVQLKKAYSAGGAHDLIVNDQDTLIYFKIKGNDLNVYAQDNYQMSIEGNWNAEVFKALAQDSSIACYDLTRVKGVNSQPEAANPNALFYINAQSQVQGYNIIREGICNDLRLTNGYNFQPTEDFTAVQAEFVLHTVPVRWNYIVLPFDCQVPSGCMARRISTFSSIIISEADEINTSMQQGTPYLYKATSPYETLSARDVTISIRTTEQETDSIKATFVNLVSEENHRTLNDEDVQSFVSLKTGSVIPAFSGYLDYAYNVSTRIINYASTDKQRDKLAEMLVNAGQALTECANKVTEDVQDDFIRQINEAGWCYTEQTESDLIKNTAEQLSEQISAFKKSIVLGDSPVELTEEYLADPSFESGRTNQWDIERATGQSSVVHDITSLQNFMSNAEGTHVFYSYSNTGKGSVTLSQTITGLPAGVYGLKANLGTDENHSVTLFANDQTATTTIDDFGKRYLIETSIDSIEVTDGTLTFGVKGNDTWYKADHFRLYYQGKGTTGIQFITENNSSLKVWAQYGKLNLRTHPERAEEVNIYHINGQKIKQIRVKGHMQISDLPKGIYLVNRQKIIIR